MTVTVRREVVAHNAILGTLLLNGASICDTMERQDVAIPSGTYPLALTVSQRSLSGKLWSPDPNHLLPLIENVPGRSGIRMHAANYPSELEGCIAVGTRLTSGALFCSRHALVLLLNTVKWERPNMVVIEALPAGPVTA